MKIICVTNHSSNIDLIKVTVYELLDHASNPLEGKVQVYMLFYVIVILLVGWLVVFYVPSTARSFRDCTPIYCPLQGT